MVGVAQAVLEVCLCLPTTYWAGLAQHQASLSPSMFEVQSLAAHRLWRKVMVYLEAELSKPRDDSVKIVAGMRLEARFAGRKAYFGATVLRVHEDNKHLDLKYDSSFARAKAARSQGQGGGGGGGDKVPAFTSSLLDDGEIEKGVPLSLTRLYPKTPRTPREDHLLRVVSHLRKVLRLGTERAVELAHHRRHFLPKLDDHIVPRIAPGEGATLWMAQKPCAVRGLYDINRADSFVHGGRYGWPPTDDSFGAPMR